VKFTPSGGDVEVCWEWVDRPEREARVVGEASAGALRVSVRDTGIGIAPADQEAIWDEFRQLQPAGEGTGLGLALTRRLVGLLGGRVWLESEPGRGSTFTFVLPRQLPERSAAPEPLPAVTPGRRLALVIEDHPPTNKLLCDWLRDAGLRAESALDGVTGVAEARRLLPQLIVLDIHLPGLDGWQVLEELKADPTTAAIPVVIVSISDPELPARGLPVQAIFVKPIDRDEFLRRLGQHLPVARPDQANP
jgi:CheY-like chemotaxis protein